MTKSTRHSVKLFISALLKDPEFILYLEKIVNEQRTGFSFEEIMELENIRSSQKIINSDFKKKFTDLGLIEKQGTTSDSRYILSHRYYLHVGKQGVHTRLSALKREKYKQMILEHLSRNGKGYAHEFKDAFSELSATTINNILRDLKKDGLVSFSGPRKTGYWAIVTKNST